MAQDNNRYYNNYDPSSVLPGDLAYEIDEVNTSECDNLKENKGTSGNDNNNCDVLSNELIEAIRQVYYSLKNGDIVISANEDSKCDGSQLPTIASILSRLLRFDEAVACILCTYDPILIKILKSGEYPQVLMGQTGSVYPVWKNVSETPTEGSMLPITSGGVYDAIQEAQLSMFHKITDDPNWVAAGGQYNYAFLAKSLEDLKEQSKPVKCYIDLTLQSFDWDWTSYSGVWTKTGIHVITDSGTTDGNWRTISKYEAVALKSGGKTAAEISELFNSIEPNQIATGTNPKTTCPNYADPFIDTFFPVTSDSPFYGKMIYGYQDTTRCSSSRPGLYDISRYETRFSKDGVAPEDANIDNVIPRLWGIALMYNTNTGEYKVVKYSADGLLLISGYEYFSYTSDSLDTLGDGTTKLLSSGHYDFSRYTPYNQDQALVSSGGVNELYIYDASVKQWINGGRMPTPMDYSVISISKGTYATKELYWLSTSDNDPSNDFFWNLMDASISDINERMDKIEGLYNRAVLSADFDTSGKKYALTVRDTYDDAVNSQPVDGYTTIALVIGAP